MKPCPKSGQCHFGMLPHHLFVLTTVFLETVLFTLVARHNSIYLVIKPLYPSQGQCKFLPENTNKILIIEESSRKHEIRITGQKKKKRLMCKLRQSDLTGLLIFPLNINCTKSKVWATFHICSTMF